MSISGFLIVGDSDLAEWYFSPVFMLDFILNVSANTEFRRDFGFMFFYRIRLLDW